LIGKIKKNDQQSRPPSQKAREILGTGMKNIRNKQEKFKKG